jgi:uncharacterized protein (DUF2147 family)
MKRLACLAVLMALSSPAFARDSYSFTVHGHRIHVEADRRCRSLSCVSISIPGVGNWHNRRDHDEDDVAAVRELRPASAPTAPQPALMQTPAQTAPAPAPVAPPMSRTVTVPPTVQAQPLPQPAPIPAVPSAPVQPVPVAAPTVAAAAAETKPVATTSSTTPPPAAEPAVTQPQQSRSFEKRQDKPLLQAPAAAAQPAGHASETLAADSPLGDWKTDGKNPTLVHIESCGKALCGYVLDAATKAKGESILVNMKPKTDAEWSGNIYSRTSGNSYYGTITLKQADTLRVEACAFAGFLCSANNWRRLQPKPDEIMTSERAAATPRS